MQYLWFVILALVGAVPTAVAQERSFGIGCKGPLAGVPKLSLAAPPVAGRNIDLELDVFAPSRPFFLVMGLNNKNWSGIPLPLDMTQFGFPGCFLNVEYRRPFPMLSDAQGKLKLVVSTGGIRPGERFYAQLVVPGTGPVPALGSSAGFEITIVASVKPYSLIAIPDSQAYSVSPTLAQGFDAQTKWIANNVTAENIEFVSHVGDLVQNGAQGPNKNQAEWDRVLPVMKRLDGDLTSNPDGLVPYGIVIGNHDYDTVDNKTQATKWNTHFGPGRVSGRTWFAGAATNGRNQCQIFRAGGQDFMHLALEWFPTDDAIAWAQSKIVANPTLPTIVTTHQYLGWGAAPRYDFAGATPNSGGDNSGEGVREKLVEPFPQVFMVLCGHFPGGSYKHGNTRLGQRVLECLFNYQSDANGGNGWMNLLEFSPDQAQVRSDCFSPIYIPGVTIGLDRNNTVSNNFVLDFDVLGHRRKLEATATVHFAEGRDLGGGIYAGTEDTYVRNNLAASSFGSSEQLRVDTDGMISGTQDQSLLKFGGLFGKGVGQIPRDRHIARAVLTLTSEGAYANSYSVSDLYQLTVPFTESSTWDSLGNGIQVGTETVATAVTNTGTRVQAKGTRSFDVTATLRSWQDGVTNHGWALINRGADAWVPRSSEFGTPVERPMLTVIYEN
ncbi:MAG: DNRLRE domain-containing protein [Planctomycetota bacterium]|nr:DNRLRE domain-containing protein [Planctomycetota bacterium]